MNLTLNVANTEIAGDVRRLVEARLAGIEKALGKDADTALIAVEAGKASEHHKSGAIYRAEANVDADGKLYRATAEEETMEAAIDTVARELMRELRKSRGRTRHYIRKGGAAIKSMLRGFRS